MHLRDRVNASAYPMPTPVVATSVKERKLLQTQRSFIAVQTLATQAKVTFVGIGAISQNAPLREDGFISEEEIKELLALGAVGEIAGWAYDPQGTLLKKGTNTRVAGVPLEQPAKRLTIGIAGGLHKTEAILAALKGRLVNGLITDESAAEAILRRR